MEGLLKKLKVKIMKIKKFLRNDGRCVRKRINGNVYKKFPRCRKNKCPYIDECEISLSKLNMEVKKSKQKTS